MKGLIKRRLPSMRMPVPVDQIDNASCAVYAEEAGKPEDVRLQKYGRGGRLSGA